MNRSSSVNKNSSASKTIFLVAGDSGGHITPALTLGSQWKTKHPDGSIIFLGKDKALDKKILAQAQHLTRTILFTLPRITCWKLPLVCMYMLLIMYKSIKLMRHYKPSHIISTGGHIAIPVCLAAKLLRIPIELYELNAIPGKASKLIHPIATQTFITFKQSKAYIPSATIIDYPLQFRAHNTSKVMPERSSSLRKKTIFVLGGSQGSLFLNNLVKRIVPLLDHNIIRIIHQTGSIDKTDWHAFYSKHPISATHVAYTNKMQYFYVAADLVIARGGAGTLFEIDAYRHLKSIIIPLQHHAANHQVQNAHAMAMQNAHMHVINQDFFKQQDASRLFAQIVHDHLFGNPVKERQRDLRRP